MAKPLVSDELWRLVEPLIPNVERRYRFPGRKRIDDRKVLTGILFVLQTGIPWEYLPQEMGCGSGMTCWRRLKEWQEAGVWGRLLGDGAYHSRRHRGELRARGIAATIPRPKQPHGSGLGKQRWVVERTIAWLHQYRRLRIRYERRDDIHEAFLAIGCSLICLRLLQAGDSFLKALLGPCPGSDPGQGRKGQFVSVRHCRVGDCVSDR